MSLLRPQSLIAIIAFWNKQVKTKTRGCRLIKLIVDYKWNLSQVRMDGLVMRFEQSLFILEQGLLLGDCASSEMKNIHTVLDKHLLLSRNRVLLFKNLKFLGASTQSGVIIFL